MVLSLASLRAAISADPGLRAQTPASQITMGLAAVDILNDLLISVITATHVNDDGILSAADMATISTAVYANPADYVHFLEAHGNDNGNVVSGFHYIQNDGGSLMFRGRAFIDTVADAIYHFGFRITDGRYVNEDGASNETTRDVAGWLNYFLNGVNVVHGSEGNDDLGSGSYSAAFAAAANETFMAGAGNDNIWADVGNDIVYGGDGNDRSGGGLGNDQLFGEAGNDTLWGEAGQDFLQGGMGHDVLGAGAGNDTLFGMLGDDTLYGEDGDDTMDGGDGADLLYASNGNDLLRGGAGTDRLSGDMGRDRIEGGADADQLWGGAGSDTLNGGDGNDQLSGGEGVDFLRGGTGADEFSLWETVQSRDNLIFYAGESGRMRDSIDRVEGFVSGVDKVFLAGFGAMTFEDLDYRGGGAASCYYDGQFLRIDGDGDRATDMMIEFRWVESLVASDLIFA